MWSDREKGFSEICQGTLFASDFLQESIAERSDWHALDPLQVEGLKQKIERVFQDFPTDQTPNESQTEDDLIWQILKILDWTSYLRQQNLSASGRENIPDGLLFSDAKAKAQANRRAEEWKRYELGLAIVESKRWQRPLDRQTIKKEERTAPSTQMLRYLRRVDDLTSGKLRWGILTNGAKWRLYYQGARSVSEQFFEIDLAAVCNATPSDLTAEERLHWLRVFILAFRRNAFLPGETDARTFHQQILEEGLYYERRVAGNLSDLVFEETFPTLIRTIAQTAPKASLEEVRQTSLMILYRLLFIFYAEDRNLLPIREQRYRQYSMREVRSDIAERKQRDETFSAESVRYWSAFRDLCRLIGKGDDSIGLPPYNGGLFEARNPPLISAIRINDEAMAGIIDALAYERTEKGLRGYINYRDLNVQQLGSIYERLLEYQPVRDGDRIMIRPNPFARKTSGSYYTPEPLVQLIIRETMDPLIQECLKSFRDSYEKLSAEGIPDDIKQEELMELDPAEKLLELKVCDAAMGSGHFLVSFVDYLSDHVIAAIAESEAVFVGYASPLTARILKIRSRIMGNARRHEWSVSREQLNDRHIIRRMVLKRCVYGVDKNPMAVELAKVSLWLHTFTVGAPLSFLDHHLRCGDSLFGAVVKSVLDKAKQQGVELFLDKPIKSALRAAVPARRLEQLTDVEISEARFSSELFEDIKDRVNLLDSLLSFIHACEWLDIRDNGDKLILAAFLEGKFGDPASIAAGESKLQGTEADAKRCAQLLGEARTLIEEERFLNWQVFFPGVWSDWEKPEFTGGFDAVIGNPPWDCIKMQKVEWFAARAIEIEAMSRAADRNTKIKALQKAKDPLAEDYVKVEQRAKAAARVARTSGNYPFFAMGDINLYSLFVERAMALIKSEGMIGLLTPSGIAADKTAAKFFRRVATEGRLKSLYDFENRRTRHDSAPFFPDVDSRFKFCTFIASRTPLKKPAQCAFFLQDTDELADPTRCFSLSAEDFAHVNPNTGTAPIFRTRRDAELTTAIYQRLPVLVDRSSGKHGNTWPVKYVSMFHMTGDSHLFATQDTLEKDEKAYLIAGNHYKRDKDEWLPLYTGRMFYQFDHRAASVQVNPENIHTVTLTNGIEPEQKSDPDFVPIPQYWVPTKLVEFPSNLEWALAFRSITNATNARTAIASILPHAGLGHSASFLMPQNSDYMEAYRACAPLLLAHFNTAAFDYVARQKIQGTNFSMYILEQLPFVSMAQTQGTDFGKKTAYDLICEIVLELTYTAHDMAPFARDMGYTTKAGKAKAPFKWDENRRLHLKAKLDAIFFHLFQITDPDEVRYIYSTFPIVQQEEEQKLGGYHSRDLCLAYMNALEAGDPDAKVSDPRSKRA